MHWSPNLSAARATKSGSLTAAVLIETLSAPLSSKLADILDGADAAADRHRHEALLGGAGDDVEDGLAVFGARGDVEKAEFVGARGVIGERRLDRIAGVDQIDELHAFDDAAVLHVEAGNDAGFQGHLDLARSRRVLSSAKTKEKAQKMAAKMTRIKTALGSQPWTVA